MDATPEEWRPIVGYENLYEVSSFGRVKSLRGSTRILRPWIHQGGYEVVTLCENGRRCKQYIHILVLTTFRGACPDGLLCCHSDGNPTNNRLENLRWDTQSSNLRDSVRHGKHPWANKTHCPRKHEYTPENTYIYRGRRNCRRCEKERTIRRREARQAAARDRLPCAI